MTSCHYYQENEENLPKQVDKTKLKTTVYCSKPVNHPVISQRKAQKNLSALVFLINLRTKVKLIRILFFFF